MVKAAFEALKLLQSPRAVAARRGRKVSDILGPRGGDAPTAEPQSEVREAADG
jgi:small subunit ribosomal protein S5